MFLMSDVPLNCACVRVIGVVCEGRSLGVNCRVKGFGIRV